MLDRPSEGERFSDIVADGRFVVFTGAGVSSTLSVRGRTDERLPQWPELLGRLGRQFADQLTPSAIAEFKALLHLRATADELIEAGSILSDAVGPAELEAAISAQVATEPGQSSETHRRIAQLEPRGVITLNYDDAHETALKAEGNLEQWQVVLSSDDAVMATIVEARFARPFLLKAHGSTGSTHHPLALSGGSYRHLLTKAPAYRAFLRHLITEFNFVFIGFGMQDPDFKQCLDEMSNAYGRPVRDHILITRRITAPKPEEDLPNRYSEAMTAREVLLRRRYGIHTLYVDRFGDIPKLLDEVLSMEGPQIRSLIDDCLSRDITLRRRGHLALVALSAIGKRRALTAFRRRAHNLLRQSNLSAQEEFELSELIYALGTISRMPEAREFLLEIAEEALHKEVMAHALVALIPAVKPGDEFRLRRIEERCRQGQFVDALGLADANNRLPTYAQTLVALAQARGETPDESSVETDN